MGESSLAPDPSHMTPSIKKDQKLKDSFSEAAFGDSADSVWLKGKKAELDKQILFLNP